MVDAEGNTKVIMAGDGAKNAYTEEARRKAYTAAQMRLSITALQAAMALNPHMLVKPDRQFLILPGAVPLRSGSTVIGAIGVSGGNPPLEESCAAAAVEALQPYLHPEDARRAQ